MGHIVPDRMFWAEPDDEDEASDEDDDLPSLEGFGLPPHDTKH
jgi:hydroxymethylpyrimidine/phosphomethylpyrimidine kinase